MRGLLAFFFLSSLLALAASASAASTLAIEAYVFKPASLEVEPGADVLVTNADGEPHALKAIEGGELLADVEANGQVTFRAPTTPGEHAYYCPYHTSPTAEGDFMKGVLVVRASATPAPSSTPASATPASASTPATSATPLAPLALGMGLLIAVALRKR